MKNDLKRHSVWLFVCFVTLLLCVHCYWSWWCDVLLTKCETETEELNGKNRSEAAWMFKKNRVQGGNMIHIPIIFYVVWYVFVFLSVFVLLLLHFSLYEIFSHLLSYFVRNHRLRSPDNNIFQLPQRHHNTELRFHFHLSDKTVFSTW